MTTGLAASATLHDHFPAPPRAGLVGAATRHRHRRAGPPFTVGICVPMRGSAGIWSPSCLAAARLAEGELNRGAGIDSRPCELLLIDAADESPNLESTLLELVDEGEVDALVGICISTVRERIVGAVRGRVNFVHSFPYEGGESASGVYAIGETSKRQLVPSIHWLHAHGLARRWMLVGQDSVWPRASHRIARACIANEGGTTVAEAMVPFGCTDFTEVFDRLCKSHADAVLISLTGQDAVDFNRAFGAAGLARHVVRMACAIEESQLLAIGAEHTENLHVALGYFESLDTIANVSFKERYRQRFGTRAPALNAFGQSLYEGLHFLATLLEQEQTPPCSAGPSIPPLSVRYPSARGATYVGGGITLAPMYLARAEGHAFQVLSRF